MSVVLMVQNASRLTGGSGVMGLGLGFDQSNECCETVRVSPVAEYLCTVESQYGIVP